MCGCWQPAPMTSQALSAAAAIKGVPTAMPVAALAAAVMLPMRVPGSTSSGNHSGLMAKACHFQSPGLAQARRL